MPLSIDHLIKKNADWSAQVRSEKPDFFSTLAHQQKPEFLWIGCSDSRVPANEIVGLLPGELFVHRNVANIIVTSDLNCQSVIEYAVGVLRVKHIIVCGHYGCGGVAAALDHQYHGLIDHWLTPIKAVALRHQKELDALPTETEKLDRMCELNVLAQVQALSHSPIVQSAWARGQLLRLHGWIYGLENGLIKVLDVDMRCMDDVEPGYRFDIA